MVQSSITLNYWTDIFSVWNAMILFNLSEGYLIASTYCLSRCQGIWILLLFERELSVSLVRCRSVGCTEARRRHPSPQTVPCSSTKPQRGNNMHIHTQKFPSHTLNPKILYPYPHFLLLAPSKDWSHIERELETMLVLSEDLPALTSTWTFSGVLLGLDRE